MDTCILSEHTFHFLTGFLFPEKKGETHERRTREHDQKDILCTRVCTYKLYETHNAWNWILNSSNWQWLLGISTFCQPMSFISSHVDDDGGGDECKTPREYNRFIFDCIEGGQTCIKSKRKKPQRNRLNGFNGDIKRGHEKRGLITLLKQL